MVIFLDPVSPLQFFGYSIALAGLVYYKLGGEGIKNGFRDAQNTYHSMNAQNPARVKAMSIGAGVAAALFLLFIIYPALTASGTGSASAMTI
jgi:hypothetical protein